MPNIKSAIKRVSVTSHKNLRNRMVRSKVKTAIKKFEADKALETYNMTVSEIDKAVAKGIIHKNTAARKKARLAKKIAQ